MLTIIWLFNISYCSLLFSDEGNTLNVERKPNVALMIKCSNCLEPTAVSEMINILLQYHLSTLFLLHTLTAKRRTILAKLN